jgi:Carboxypeptidase regulatory-like domain
MRKVLAAMAFVCLVLSASGDVFGQTSNGQVGGVVQDPSRALIPGASATLINTETGVTTMQVTNETGAYNFASVPPGTYRVSALLPGFKTSITNGVLVRPRRCSKLHGIHRALLESIKPEKMNIYLRWILPFVTHGERVAILASMQHAMPRPVFEQLLALIRLHLSAKDWRKLNGLSSHLN